ncbi:cation diffusion facilitator family transporter [uncultured Duncaniella sp.]|uniref:cation diffusion facilitator family transporter n=1 Tax=uncultured Duncaniella sp. TaxID=2768039 RepID=UPI002676629D|nr:cation diffusion facilitator family transporter [uncultured Duncaniella sp.]
MSIAVDAREREIYRVTLIGSAVNAVLIVLKFIAGIFGKSSAMIADAVHSLSDFITDVIVLVFVKIAGKPRDKGHDYGHGKFETFATMIIGLLLSLAGVGLLANGIDLVIKSCNGHTLERPTMLALVIAVVSILSKEWLYRFTAAKGREVNSQAVVANAWHHRSDAISSAGTLVGVAGAMFLGDSWRILDPVAAIVVSLFIIKSGYDIMKPSVNELLESSLPEAQETEIRQLVLGVPGIISVHNLRTRRIGNGIAVDMHAKMDGSISLTEAHSRASAAEMAIRGRFGANAIINIHMEPVTDRGSSARK